MSNDLSIPSLRGGFDDSTPPHLIADDQCTIAENVEFFFSTIAERRMGCDTYDITDSTLDGETAIAFMAQWFPNSDNIFFPEKWAASTTWGVSVTLARRTADVPGTPGVWGPISPTDALSFVTPLVFQMSTQAFNNKLFFSYKSPVNFFHVWDGTTLRRVGIAQPIVAPTAVDEGSGTYSQTRYFRVRFVETVGGQVVRRSEPSDSVTFSPSGSGNGATITRPATVGEGETDWELEASVNNADFYHIATIAIATTTHDDETDLATTDYADEGPLSEPIGDYLPISSYKYVVSDGDRLVLGGHWDDINKHSEIAWTPVRNDPGVGNDERLPLASENNDTLSLDPGEGGEITGLTQTSNGTLYVFKWGHIYKLARTGDVTHAYTSITLSKSMGAIPGSIVNGVDENGRACVYFLDPLMGPARLGSFGLQWIRGLRNTWRRVNPTATIGARGVYYADKQQVRWIVAADGLDVPSLGLTLQTNEITSTPNGATRGWSLVTGHLPQAYTLAIWNELIVNEEGGVTLSGRPMYGFTTPDFIQRGDITNTDAGQTYHAKVRTKSFITAGLLNQWGAMTGALLATANDTDSVMVSFIRDFGRFGLDTQSTTTDLAPAGIEPYVVKTFDELQISECIGIQVQFEDPL